MTTPPPARLLVLALTDAEATLLTDALAHELGDDQGLEPATEAVVGRLQAAIATAASTAPDPWSPLPEQDVLRLPAVSARAS